MKSKSLSFLFSAAGLAFLAACECGDKESRHGIDEPQVVEVVQDDALSGAGADFIANAGDRVFYAYDKSNLSPEAEATLLRQAEWLKNNSSRKVLIEGHCDERGTREYNLGLGERRADSAARFLIDKGIEGERIRTISYGKDRPIAATGSKEEIYRVNRVSISVIE